MNRRRLAAIAFKETLQIWRDPHSLAIALLIPLMQMALPGYGVSLDVQRVPLCICEQENSTTSRELVEHFVASGCFSVARPLPDGRALGDAVDRGARRAAITMPLTFPRVLATTGRATVQTVFDATDTNTTKTTLGLRRA